MEMQYNIWWRVYIFIAGTQEGAPQNVPKCRTITGTTLYCLRQCKEIKVFWTAICKDRSTEMVQQLLPIPLLCLLRRYAWFFEESVQFLLMLVRKAVRTKWVESDSTSVQLWKPLISDDVTLEKLRFDLLLQRIKVGENTESQRN